ncbi:MAG: S-adenosylmethionine:tRNA ribosyltransferase-isomerase [Paludibacteraceae bacterium]|nr:S-adenosylmethionine:tRNA ribosyltransferase-isomerase [Paludibacteraceae bacterium]
MNCTEAIRSIQIADYDYPLPDERIAKYPLADRSACKLLVYRGGRPVETARFDELGQYLPKDSLLVFNNTRVIQARLQFYKKTGGQIEIFCLEPLRPADYQLNFQQTAVCVWKCMVGNLKKWKEGAVECTCTVGTQNVVLRAERLSSYGLTHEIKFSWSEPSLCFADILTAFGQLPIPPYLHRETEESDKENYQTVYSKIKGSVAAPTAGLHFTDELLSQLNESGIRQSYLTLHVGAGTFQPVKSDDIGGHEMHTEVIEVKRDTLVGLRRSFGHIVAVGTTSVRTLESLYWLGCRVLQGNEPMYVTQWEAYESTPEYTPEQALDALVGWLDRNGQDTLHARTQILIAPGYLFRIINGMVTNFHQPKSTLLLLLAAYVGDSWRSIYKYALEHDYRFLSYGDASLLLR